MQDCLGGGSIVLSSSIDAGVSTSQDKRCNLSFQTTCCHAAVRNVVYRGCTVCTALHCTVLYYHHWSGPWLQKACSYARCLLFPLAVAARGTSTRVVSICSTAGKCEAAAAPRGLICSRSLSPCPRPRRAGEERSLVGTLLFRVLIEHDPNAIKTAAGRPKLLATPRFFGHCIGRRAQPRSVRPLYCVRCAACFVLRAVLCSARCHTRTAQALRTRRRVLGGRRRSGSGTAEYHICLPCSGTVTMTALAKVGGIKGSAGQGQLLQGPHKAACAIWGHARQDRSKVCLGSNPTASQARENSHRSRR